MTLAVPADNRAGQASLGVASWLVASVYIVLGLIVLYPIASVEIPGLADFPNHLARAHILRTIQTSRDLQAAFEVDWSLTPYLAFDAIVPQIARVLPIYEAGRLFVAVCVLSPVIGAVTLHYAAYRRFGLEPAIAFLFCYNLPLSWGFLNFLFMSNLALMLFGGWIAASGWPRWRRAALFTPLVLLIYFGHAFAFAIFCMAVGGFELSRTWRGGFASLRAVAMDWLSAAAPAVPAALLLLRFDPTQGFAGPLQTQFGEISDKLSVAVSPLIFSYSDFGAARPLLLLDLLGVVLLILCRRRLSVSPLLWPSAALMALGAVLAPDLLIGVWGTHFRLPLICAILLAGGLSLRVDARGGAILLLLLAGLVAAHSAMAAATLRLVDRQIADVRRVLEQLPRGARLLTVDVRDARAAKRVGDARWTSQIEMFAVIDRDAFVPRLFGGITPVEVRPELLMSSTPIGPPLRMKNLLEGLSNRDESTGQQSDGGGFGGRVYWNDWPKKFDYLLVVHVGSSYELPPINLTRLATSPTADLFRIDGKTP
jgi:hypothetical protein